MRIVFCGSGTLAPPVLRAVTESRHELLYVLTQPPRPAGRGGRSKTDRRSVRPTPLALAAEEMGLTAAECPDVNAPDVVASIRDHAPDVICVADFGQMIRKPVRDCARLDAINLHASLLPELRGAAPVRWAIIRGYPKTGVTAFSLVDALDAGPVLARRETEIDPDETAQALKARLADLGAQLVCQTLDALAGGEAERTEQDHGAATLAPLLKKSDGVIDWQADAAAIRNRIHGTWPWPGGQTVFHGAGGRDLAVVIARAAVAGGDAAGEPGTVDDELCVAAGRGRVRIVELRPAGGRLMDFRDFVNGYRVSPGDGFAAKER